MKIFLFTSKHDIIVTFFRHCRRSFPVFAGRLVFHVFIFGLKYTEDLYVQKTYL